MKRKNSKLSVVLFLILIILPIYKDSPLSLYLGAAGFTFLMPLSLILILMYILLRGKKIKNEFLHKLFNLAMWLIVTSFVGFIVWLVLGNPVDFLGEFLPFKAVKVILQYLSYPAYVTLLIICLRDIEEKKALKYCYLVMILLVVIDLIEMTQIPYAFQNLHFSGILPYYRVRLLTLEASDTTTLILIYCGLSLYYSLKYKRKFAIMITTLSLLIFITTTNAKSLLISIGIFIIIYIIIEFKNLKKSNIIVLILLVILLIFFTYFILPRFLSTIDNDINNYTSVATRGYTIFVGLVIGLVFPVGVGGAAYLGILKNYMNKLLIVFNYLPLKFNLSEILFYMNGDTDISLTVKSGIMHYNLYWGILGTMYLLNVFKILTIKYKRLNLKKGNLLLTLFWTNIILLILVNNFSFEFWLLFAILASNIEKNEMECITNERK